jgi:hypothetical protein
MIVPVFRNSPFNCVLDDRFFQALVSGLRAAKHGAQTAAA